MIKNILEWIIKSFKEIFAIGLNKDIQRLIDKNKIISDRLGDIVDYIPPPARSLPVKLDMSVNLFSTMLKDKK